MSFLDNDPEMQELIGHGRSAGASVSGDVLPPGADAPKAIAGGAYEGAARFDRELALWSPSYGSADADLLFDKPELDARTRDLTRNDAFIKSGMTIRKDSIVGSMYVLNSKPEFRVLGLDEKWAEEFQEEVETKFTLYAESIFNHVDAAGVNNFTNLIRLGVGCEMVAGEVIALADWIKDPARPYNTAIMFVDPDRVSNPPTLMRDKNVRGGVRKNSRGRPVGYYIRNTHPVDIGHYSILEEWKYVPARLRWGRQQVIHLYETMRPDQTRGVAAMVAALKEIRITKQFRDIVLQNAIVNATFAASIESELPPQTVFEQLGGGAGNGGEAIASYATSYLSAVHAYGANAKNAHLNGARIPHLFPGTKLQLRPAAQGGPLGTEFEASLLRYIAANLDVSYEQLSRDYSNINYSTLKGSVNQTRQAMQSRKRMTADRLASHIYMLWLEEAFARGDITSLSRKAPNFWEGLNREAYGACEWIGASMGQIDELKETQAAVLRLKYGLSTYEDELGRLGRDWRKSFRQEKREKDLREDLGVNTVTDPNMMNAASGAPREKASHLGGTIENDFMDGPKDEDEELV